MPVIHSEAFLFWGSTVSSLLNIFTTFAFTRHWRWGWLAALFVQIPWAVFGLLSGQYAFIALSGIYSWLYLTAYRTHPQPD